MQPPTAAVVVAVGAKHQSTYVVSSDHFVRTTTGLELMTDRWLVADPSTSSPPRPPSRDRETGTHPTHPVLRLLSGSPACSLPRPRHNSHGPRPSLFFPLLFRLPPLLRLEAYSFRLPLSSPLLFCFICRGPRLWIFEGSLENPILQRPPFSSNSLERTSV
jgi:hypothetical protein